MALHIPNLLCLCNGVNCWTCTTSEGLQAHVIIDQPLHGHGIHIEGPGQVPDALIWVFVNLSSHCLDEVLLVLGNGSARLGDVVHGSVLVVGLHGLVDSWPGDPGGPWQCWTSSHWPESTWWWFGRACWELFWAKGCLQKNLLCRIHRKTVIQSLHVIQSTCPTSPEPQAGLSAHVALLLLHPVNPVEPSCEMLQNYFLWHSNTLPIGCFNGSQLRVKFYSVYHFVTMLFCLFL